MLEVFPAFEVLLTFIVPQSSFPILAFYWDLFAVNDPCVLSRRNSLYSPFAVLPYLYTKICQIFVSQPLRLFECKTCSGTGTHHIRVTLA